MGLIMLTSQGAGRTLSEYSAGLIQCQEHADAQLAIPTRTLGSKKDKKKLENLAKAELCLACRVTSRPSFNQGLSFLHLDMTRAPPRPVLVDLNITCSGSNPARPALECICVSRDIYLSNGACGHVRNGYSEGCWRPSSAFIDLLKQKFLLCLLLKW